MVLGGHPVLEYSDPQGAAYSWATGRRFVGRLWKINGLDQTGLSHCHEKTMPPSTVQT